MRPPVAVATLSIVLISGLLTVLAGQGSASFTDRMHGTGNSFVAAELVAPAGLTAHAAGGPGASIALGWTPGVDDVSDGWEILRKAGECSGWSPSEGDSLASVGAAPLSYPDAAAEPGQVYCYAVRGTRGSWTSPASPLAEVSFALGTLFLHQNGSDRTLETGASAGSSPFGCLAVVLLTCVLPAPESYTFRSVQPLALPAAGGWRVSLRVANNNLLSVLGTSSLGIQLWYVAGGACGAPPGDSARMADANIDLGAVLLDALGLLGTGTVTVTSDLAGAAAFLPPAVPAHLCLQVDFDASGLLSLLGATSILHGGETWVQGPMP